MAIDEREYLNELKRQTEILEYIAERMRDLQKFKEEIELLNLDDVKEISINVDGLEIFFRHNIYEWVLRTLISFAEKNHLCFRISNDERNIGTILFRFH